MDATGLIQKWEAYKRADNGDLILHRTPSPTRWCRRSNWTRARPTCTATRSTSTARPRAP
ncbi:hypothetical protein HK414_15980 [Ramlibacter terrae]|uniref:Uncharacterized protein n=1 Tax=Ramlibacter terrae TaxID=2732511 RepID=A0ABX6P3J7_9BURK|nr:hypothetical protein HK414_15980 [Ramlibacter terrae]